MSRWHSDCGALELRAELRAELKAELSNKKAKLKAELWDLKRNVDVNSGKLSALQRNMYCSGDQYGQ